MESEHRISRRSATFVLLIDINIAAKFDSRDLQIFPFHDSLKRNWSIWREGSRIDRCVIVFDKDVDSEAEIARKVTEERVSSVCGGKFSWTNCKAADNDLTE